MQHVTITNPVPALSADHVALGAAVRILIAGGSILGKENMRNASGVSAYVWGRKHKEIMDLVRDLEKPLPVAG